jgi:hypothetical protein
MSVELQQHTCVATDTDVVAVGCLFEEFRLMATKGVVTCKGSTLDSTKLGISTCKITKLLCVTLTLYPLHGERNFLHNIYG